jgi:hypothetical protein
MASSFYPIYNRYIHQCSFSDPYKRKLRNILQGSIPCSWDINLCIVGEGQIQVK